LHVDDGNKWGQNWKGKRYNKGNDNGNSEVNTVRQVVGAAMIEKQ
jgi:hypothetical protein